MPCYHLNYDQHQKVFNVVADVLEWCIAKDDEEILYHYLDDFVEHLFLLQACGQLGVPLAPEKQDGSSTCTTYLGIIIRTSFSKSWDYHKRSLTGYWARLENEKSGNYVYSYTDKLRRLTPTHLYSHTPRIVLYEKCYSTCLRIPNKHIIISTCTPVSRNPLRFNMVEVIHYYHLEW